MTKQMTKQTDEVEILTGTADLRALLESGAGYRMAFESVQDYAIFAMDPEGKVASWNPGAEHLLGYGQEEIFGRDAAIFFTPEERERGVPQQELRTAAEKGRAIDDRWHVRKDGSYFFANGITTGLRDAAGTSTGSSRSCATAPTASARRGAAEPGRGAGAGGPGEGRVPGDAGARAAQPAGADPQRPATCSRAQPAADAPALDAGASWTARSRTWRG